MSDIESSGAQAEHRNHRYSSNRIPFYVRLVWIGFWSFAIYYTLTYLIPAL